MLVKPVFIVGNPRSGTSLLRSCLQRSSHLWTIGREGKPIWEKRLHPKYKDWHSNQLDETDATEEIVDELQEAFLDNCVRPLISWNDEDKVFFLKWMHAQGVSPYYYDLPLDVLKKYFPGDMPEGPAHKDEVDEITPFCFPIPSRKPTQEELSRGIRMLEKSIQTCFRMPFARKIFPDAKFIFIVRDGRANISSLIDAWLNPRCFFSYKMPVELHIKGYSDVFPWGKTWWNLYLPPGWRDVIHLTLEEVCAYSYVRSLQEILKYVTELEAGGNAILIRYEDLVARPQETLTNIARVIEIPADDALISPNLPVVMTATEPTRDKWKKHNYARIERIMPMIKEMQERFGYPDRVGSVVNGCVAKTF